MFGWARKTEKMEGRLISIQLVIKLINLIEVSKLAIRSHYLLECLLEATGEVLGATM